MCAVVNMSRLEGEISVRALETFTEYGPFTLQDAKKLGCPVEELEILKKFIKERDRTRK